VAPLAAEGFRLDLVRCDPGKSAPLHSHLTQEVFVAPARRREVFWGPLGEGSVVLEPWGTIAIPPGLSRGFRNVASEPGHLMGMAAAIPATSTGRRRCAQRRWRSASRCDSASGD